MGYILHAATITSYPSLADVTISEKYAKERADADAKLTDWRLSLPEDWRRLVVGPVESVTNGYAWLVFMPDGSKEGWSDSDLGDKYRAEFVRLFGAEFTVRWGDEIPFVEEA